MHLDERLSDLIDGRLDTEAAAEARRHLEECATCRADLDALRATRSLIRHAEAPGPRASFWYGLDARLAEERGRRRRLWLPRLLIPAAVAAAVAAILTVVPAGSVSVSVDGYVHENARYRTFHPFADQAVVTLVITDASLQLDPGVFP